MNDNFSATTRKGSAWLLAAWSLLSLLSGAVAGNRLDALVTPVAPLLGSYFGIASHVPVAALPSSVEVATNLILTAVFGLVAYLVAAWLAIPKFKETFLRTRATTIRRTDDAARACRAIVLTLSPLNREQVEDVRATIAWVRSAPEVNRLDLLSTLRDKDPARAGPISRTPWQQNLRQLWHHYRADPVFYFVLSKEAAAQYPLFYELADLLKPPGGSIEPAPHVFDSDKNCTVLTDYKQVSNRLVEACEKAKAIANCQYSEMCIDITAGQKVYSAAATVLTLNSGIPVSYVGTHRDGDEGEVVLYRAMF